MRKSVLMAREEHGIGCKRLFGLTLTEVVKLEYELAVQNKLPRPFSDETNLVGKDWL